LADQPTPSDAEMAEVFCRLDAIGAAGRLAVTEGAHYEPGDTTMQVLLVRPLARIIHGHS
jgi:hypothetical protein